VRFLWFPLDAIPREKPAVENCGLFIKGVLERGEVEKRIYIER